MMILFEFLESYLIHYEILGSHFILVPVVCASMIVDVIHGVEISSDAWMQEKIASFFHSCLS